MPVAMLMNFVSIEQIKNEGCELTNKDFTDDFDRLLELK